MSGIGVVTNPRSGKNRRNPGLVRQLAYVLGDRGELQQPGDLDDLARVAQGFRERAIDVLCINGGDGTIHKVLTALVRVYGTDPLPIVALLRGGTMNTTARNLGLRGRAEDLLGTVVSRYHAGDPLALVERTTGSA